MVMSCVDGVGIREVTELIRWVQYASEGQTAAVVR